MNDLVKRIEDFDISIGQAAAIGTVAIAATYYLATRPTPVKPPYDLNRQSIELPGTDHVHCSPKCKDGEIKSIYFDDVTTLYEGFQRGIHVSDNGPCLGYRPGPGQPYHWINYKTVKERATAIGSGLLNKGCPAGQQSFLGIYSKNRPEWVITEQACNMYSMVVIPLYDTLGPDACSYIMNQADIQYVVVEKIKQVEAVIDRASDTPNLKCIIALEEVTDDCKEKAAKNGLEVVTFTELETNGRDNPQEPVLPKPEDLATVCYTSGTTGNPKGVPLTHRAIVANVASICEHWQGIVQITPADVHISYLPLAHMYERMAQAWLFSMGSKIGFFQGDVKLLMDDMKTLQPTIFPSVPRLLNRVYDKIMTGVNNAGFIKKTLFKTALYMKRQELNRGVVRNNSIWDIIVFRKIQALLGGKVRAIITGAAPLSAEVMGFLRCCFGCHVFEGYGQTEAAAAITMTIPGDHSVGHVGCPVTCNLVKLVDVPDMQYYADNDQGEICAKGANVFSEYYKDPEKTASAIDSDGWLHTGDIGQWLPNGTLKVIDRKKHIFKLAQGEYIAPEKIENIYQRSQLVAQVFVHGDSLKSCVVALIVPDPETVPDLAKSKNIEGTYEELCKNKDIKAAIMDDITQLGNSSGLNSFEKVKDIYLLSEPFSVENGLLTPTFKAKREVVKKQFSEQFEEMYSKLM
ncbi:long-chain-fatty-acid--CoA ligase 5-like isoform X2 [Glandiceps talaboti]